MTIHVGLNRRKEMKVHQSIHVRDSTEIEASTIKGGVRLTLEGEGGYVALFVSPEQWRRIRDAVDREHGWVEEDVLDTESAALAH